MLPANSCESSSPWPWRVVALVWGIRALGRALNVGLASWQLARRGGRANILLMLVPQRVVNADEVQQDMPDLFDLLVPSLEESDPLADRVLQELEHYPSSERHRLIAAALEPAGGGPQRLQELVRVASRPPAWVNWTRINRAGSIFFRAGLLGSMTLGMRCLVYGYAAPVGNKPLAFSGALEKKAERRLAETARFVTAVARAEGTRPGGDGFRAAIHVRLMHAQVRRLSLQDPRWNHQAWGIPINQHDMLATVLLFSAVFVDGIRVLGVHVSEEEAEDYQHLWKWVGWVMGVREELLPSTAQEAIRRALFFRRTQGEPDDDSRALVDALMEEPLRRARTALERRRAEAQVATARGLCRALLDKETADALCLPEGGSERFVPKVRRALKILEYVRRRVTPLDHLVEKLGGSYWQWSVERGLRGGGVLFPLPLSLEGTPRGLGKP